MVTGQGTSPWSINAEDFPAQGSLREKLAFLVGYAILAPSGHNSQPWLFKVGDDHIDVLLDHSRELPVVDPFNRELTISCGAAVGLLEVASRRFSLEPAVDLLPDDAMPDLLARASFHPGAPGSISEHCLFDAIRYRRTNRTPFSRDSLPEEFVADCHDIAERHGIELQLVTSERARADLARLVSEGDRTLFHDPCFRRELASWIHSRWFGSRDGMSAESFGMPDILAGVERIVIRSFDVGKGVATADEQKVLAGTPALLVFGSADTPRGWLNTGRALGQMSLLATAYGLDVSYLNQPIESDALRPEVKSVARLTTEPQILLRAGRGNKWLEPTARRGLDDVIVDTPEGDDAAHRNDRGR